MSPLVVDKDKKKEMILRHALEVFGQKGFHRTKMADIADHAGIGKGTLYEYFTNKQELFGALFALLVEEHKERFNLPREGAFAPDKKLAELIDASFAAFDKMITIYRILLEAKSGAAEHDGLHSYDKQFAKLYQGYRKKIGVIITEGIRRKNFRVDIKPDYLASIIIAAIEGLLHQWVMDRRSFDPDSMRTVLRKCIERAIAPV